MLLYRIATTVVKAIESAVELARGLQRQRLRLLVAQVVPYAVPLETPPVLVEFQEASVSRHRAWRYGVETRVDIFLCRDADENASFEHPCSAFRRRAGHKPRRWWPTREEQLARRLRRSGHEVVVVYGEKGNTHA